MLFLCRIVVCNICGIGCPLVVHDEDVSCVSGVECYYPVVDSVLFWCFPSVCRKISDVKLDSGDLTDVPFFSLQYVPS